MDFGVLEFLNAVGGLGFFIFGMKVMSEGVQKLAGDKLRSILGAMTSNRGLGVATGFLITCLIQSSSATTVMVVSFVNAGLISLIESIGVIMGANIGTTFTGWLVTLFGFKIKIAHFAYPIIAFGMPLLFTNKAKLKSLGEFLVGFALLFLGLNYLKEMFSSISADDLQFLIQYADNGILSTILFVLVGTVLTVVVQSSSAAMTITLLLVNQGSIPLDVGAAIVLGENIGTTITANLAASVANVHAKRAARAHLIFNVFGVVWMVSIFSAFMEFIDYIYQPIHGALESIDATLVKDGENALKLSLFHTSFNILNTALLIGFVNFIGKIVIKLVPSKGDEDETFRLEYIENAAISTPELSLEEAHKELLRYMHIISKMSHQTKQLINTTDSKEYKMLLEKISRKEEVTDQMEEEISSFLTKVARNKMSDSAMRRLRGYLSITSDLERVGDIYYQVSQTLEKKKEKNVWFSPDQRNSLNEFLDLLEESINLATTNMRANSEEKVNLEAAYIVENKINQFRDKLQKEHLYNMESEEFNYQGGMHYKDIYSSFEKIGDHIVNVSEALKGKV